MVRRRLDRDLAIVADALVGGGAAFYLDTKTASQRDNLVVIPLVLLVVLVILVLLLRALLAPLLLIAGPVEASALGNILVQALALGELGSLADAHAVARASTLVAGKDLTLTPETATTGRCGSRQR